jgi:hypothetical protein
MQIHLAYDFHQRAVSVNNRQLWIIDKIYLPSAWYKLRQFFRRV